MTLKTLEQRYNEVSKQIYNRFQPERDQLLSIKPDTKKGPLGAFGSRSRVKDDTRALPVTSFIRDTKRLTNFLKSPEGLLYIGKQTVLQTGNTFSETRRYNPLSNIQIPNVSRTSRSLGAGQFISGLLQDSTIASFTGTKSTALAATSQIIADTVTQTGRPEINAYGPNYSPFLLSKPTLAQRSEKKSTILTSLPYRDVNNEAFLFGASFKLIAVGSPTQQTTEKLSNNERLKTKFANLGQKFTTNNNVGTDFYFGGNGRGYSATLNVQSGLFEEPAPRTVTENDPPINPGVDGRIAYDPLNKVDSTKKFGIFIPLDNSLKIDYTKLVPTEADAKSTTPDIINFAFQTQGTDAPIIKFRAFISSLKQATKPEFNEQKYLGRTERFVSYGGAKRTVSMAFNVVAFSKIELDAVWAKINYLTGLAFPLGVSSSGFMIPPLFKISIGNIYDAQPCYIDNIDFDLIDDKITFDVDNEVPHNINVTMAITLLEKRTRFYNSPFYAITQNMVDRP